jgi:hypothetical protein
MASDRKARLDQVQDTAVAGTFPASDPPSTTADTGTRAVPPNELMGKGAPVADAVTLRRRFPSGEAAKLALEGLVRDGPVDRSTAQIEEGGADGFELKLAVPAEDAPRIRTLLARA